MKKLPFIALQFLILACFVFENYSTSLAQLAQNQEFKELSEEVYDKLSPVTVKIICNQGLTVGTGIIVGTKSGAAVILTACHVITSNFEETDPDIPLEFYQDVQIKVKSELTLVKAILLPQFIDRANDIALIVTGKTISEDRVISYVTSGNKPGQWAATFGFHKTEKLSANIGNITRLEGNDLVFNAEIGGGSSGGPVIDEHGHMIGMSRAWDKDEGEGYGTNMNIVSSVVNGWFNGIILARKWREENHKSFLVKPWFYVPAIIAVAGGVTTVIIGPGGNGAPVFSGPPDPPDN